MSNRVTAQVETVTPAIAKKMLAQVPDKQRKIVPTHVEFLAREMREGRWRLNGESIVLNGDAVLDGQHRLAAVVKSGASIQALIVRNVDSDVFATIDIGRTRTIADVLGIDGHQFATAQSAALRYIDSEVDGRISPNLYGRKMSAARAQELIAKHPYLAECARRSSAAGHKVMAPGIAAYLYYRFSLEFPEETEIFFNDLTYGVNVEADRYVYALRERLLMVKMGAANKAMRWTRFEVINATIRAFTYELEGRRIRGKRPGLVRTDMGQPSIPTKATLKIKKDRA